MKLKLIYLLFISSMLAIPCSAQKAKFINENTQFAEAQTKLMLEQVGAPTGKNYPRTIGNNDKLKTTNMYDWTPGFFPGSMWYLYELTGDTLWRNSAQEWTHSLEPLKTFNKHHDLGFMMYCSYGNARRLAPKPEYDEILTTSAASLSSRYSDKTKAIQSWNGRGSWDDSIFWNYAVIIDNMMNLELLTQGSKISGNKAYYDIAVTHANTTIANHFRDDFSSYHVIDYDTITGVAKHKMTCQGFSDNSTWARGQAWAIYGYTMMYRETQIKEYLDTAIKLTDYYLAHLPQDLIPAWDFNVGQEGYTPSGKSNANEAIGKDLRDVSAGAIVCSALFELGISANNKTYTEKAITMLNNLSSPTYRAEVGTNMNFLLMHSVGSIPHKTEVDKPLIYADYYYLEALVRYKNLK